MRFWNRLPLRTQLTAVFGVLLLVGLGLTGITAHVLLERSLVEQLDAQLSGAGVAVVNQALVRTSLPNDGDADSVLPSDYQAIILDADGAVVRRYTATPSAAKAPTIPVLTLADVAALADAPFTVDDVAGQTHWRVLALPLSDRRTASVVGTAVVALPMIGAETTLRRMQIVLLAIGLGVGALGAVAGTWGVRRSLRPLRAIEETAGAIADGDLSRRVPDAPPNTEVGRLSASLNTMLTQIEHAFDVRTASEERMRRFVADASHELRTPLATIRGYGELYRMGALTGPDDVSGTLRRIEDSATRMGSLVEDLLHLARLDEGRPQRSEPVDLLVLAADALADLRALDAGRAVRIVPVAPATTTAGALTVGDEARLRQVVANLVGNVVQHTPAGSPVELAVGRVADRAVLEVRDHGQGISPEHAPRVFERFYRVDPARGRASGGAGLGMSIVAAIVEAHRGTVALQTTPGGGATIRVSFPAADAEPEPASGEEGSTLPEEPPEDEAPAG